MEKIKIVCDENDIGITLPKRKWYESRKKQRSRTFYLNDMDSELEDAFSVAVDILLTICEKCEKTIQLKMSAEEKSKLYLAAFESLSISNKQYEEMVIFDGNEPDEFIPIITNISEHLNKLSVITNHPQAYQSVFEYLLEENGLIAECDTKFRMEYHVVSNLEEQKPYYQRQKYRKTRCLIWYAESDYKVPVRQLPKDAIFFDTSLTKKMQREITCKRPDITYHCLPNFLDTIVNRRYNILVKEGILNTHIMNNQNKKFSIKRKGL